MLRSIPKHYKVLFALLCFMFYLAMMFGCAPAPTAGEIALQQEAQQRADAERVKNFVENNLPTGSKFLQPAGGGWCYVTVPIDGKPHKALYKHRTYYQRHGDDVGVFELVFLPAGQ